MVPSGDKQVYEGLNFKLSLKFPTSYPYESPQVAFITPCFHPNVDQYGNICLDILKVHAAASKSIRGEALLDEGISGCAPIL